MGATIDPATTATAQRHLLERDDEASALLETMVDARHGRGSVHVIEGGPGLGKSALLDVAETLAGRSGLEVLRTGGAELESDYAWCLVENLLQPLHRTSEELTTRSVDAALSAIARRASTAGLAILVDDLHWADDCSVRVLDHLAARVHRLRLALVVTTLPSEHARRRSRLLRSAHHSPRHRIDLRPLSSDATAEIVRRTMATESPCVADITALHRHTAGNPGLVHEVIRHIGLDAVPWANVTSIVPPSVLHTVESALARLTPAAADLAQAFAVMSGDAGIDAAAVVARMEPAAAATAVDDLIAADLLVATPEPRFPSPLLAAAVYASLLPGRRALIHHAAAREAHRTGWGDDAVAHHLLHAAPVTQPWAVVSLRAAAADARRRGAPEEALGYLRRAVSHAAEGDDVMVDLLIDLAEAESACGFLDESIRHLRSAAERVDHPTGRAKSYFALSQLFYRSGRHHEAVEAFENSTRLTREHTTDVLLESDAAWIFSTYYRGRVSPDAVIRLDRLAASYAAPSAISVHERESLAMAALCATLSLAPAERGAALASTALVGGVLTRRGAAVSAGAATLALIFAEDLAGAATAGEEQLEVATRRGHRPEIAEASLMCALAAARRGITDRALALAEDAVTGITDRRHGMGPLAHGLYAEQLLEKGRVDEAEAVLDVAESSSTTRRSGLHAWMYTARARIHLLREDPRAALQTFQEAGDVLGRHQVTNPAVCRWRTGAAVAAHALGEPELAHELVDHDLSLARYHDLDIAVGHALTIAADLRTGDDPLALADEAVTRLADTPAARDLGMALCARGSILRAVGDIEDSRRDLRRALDLGHATGSAVLTDRAHRELVTSGCRPRRSAITGPDSLTPTESRIAVLVAQGRTDRETAEELYLAVNTVGWHLRRVYRKLGVNSRAELSAALVDR